MKATLLASKGEQYVPRNASVSWIAGTDEDHAVYDNCAGTFDGATPGLNAIRGLEIARCIEVPKNPAVLGGVRAEMSVQGRGKKQLRECLSPHRAEPGYSPAAHFRDKALVQYATVGSRR